MLNKLRELSVATFVAIMLIGTVAVPAGITGCTYLSEKFGVKQPETFEEQVALAQSGISAAQDKLKQKILNASISKNDASNVKEQLDNLVEGTGVAIELRAAGDVGGSQAKLDSAKGVLAVVRNYLGV